MANGSLFIITIPVIVGLLSTWRRYRKGEITQNFFLSVLGIVFALLIVAGFLLTYEF